MPPQQERKFLKEQSSHMLEVAGLVAPKAIVSENEKVVLAFFAVYINRNYEALYQLIAENYGDHGPTQAKNPTDAMNILKMVEVIFPDLSLQVLDIFGEGDKVAVRLLFSGTHSATFIDAPASHKKISWEAMEIFCVQNGQITESWGSWPVYDMLNQMQ